MDLLQRLRAGDEQAFVVLVRRYHDSMIRLAASFVPSRAVAEEVVQDTWMGVLRGIGGFEGRSSFRTLKVFLKGAEEQAAIEKKSEKGFGWATDLHVQNFLECVRTRQTPAAPMKLAFQAALVVQMANLSLKHGRRIRWTGDKAV